MPAAHRTGGAPRERGSIQRVQIERGANAPEHAHQAEQVGTGTGGVRTRVVDGGDRAGRAGDTFVSPGDAPHAARNDGDRPATGVEVFSPARPNPDWES